MLKSKSTCIVTNACASSKSNPVRHQLYSVEDLLRYKSLMDCESILNELERALFTLISYHCIGWPMMYTSQNLGDPAKLWRHLIPTFTIPGYNSEVFLNVVLKSCGEVVHVDLM